MFSGALTALITPMHKNGDVDFEAYKKLVKFQIENGIDGLVPIGTTGETPTLDEGEEEELIKITVKEAAGKIPVIVGAGSNSTRHAVSYTERAKRLGADAALIVTPYYNKPNDSGLVKHFEAVAEVGIPIIVYNIAGRTGRNIPTTLMAKLAKIKGIVGVKEASGDVSQMNEVLCTIENFIVLCGDDGLTAPAMAIGASGVISVISNIVPKQVVQMVHANADDRRKLHAALMPLVKAAFIETNPVPIKYAISLTGLASETTRLPLGPLSDESKKIVEEAFRGVTIHNINKS
jgi:4-hydroxy-tetrahydrodipicolinate synthase